MSEPIDTSVRFTESGKGTYALLLHLAVSTNLTIGKLGPFDFPAGWYVYVGSAFGAGGLGGRLKHHLTPIKRPHWHIDYLRQAALVEEVWYVIDPISYEHSWAATLKSLSGGQVWIPHFGSSDCSCPSHLIYFSACPSFEDFCFLLDVDCCMQRWLAPNLE